MKKDFKITNPALQFITPQETPQERPAPQDPPRQPPAPSAPLVETKSNRLNLVIKPSTAAALRKIATMKQASVNGIIGLVLEAYTQQEAATIEQYNKIFGGE